MGRQTASLFRRPNIEIEMTYNGGPSRTSNNVMKFLVIIAIVWIGYWAATGGLDQIGTPETAQSTTSTTLTE
jgi:hypothetical protein